MNDSLTVLPSILADKEVVGLGQEIRTCEAIGQKDRAILLRLQVYARLCSANSLEFLVRTKNPYDNGSRFYVIDGPDIEARYRGSPPRTSSFCPLKEWAEALPTTVVDNLLAVKGKVDTSLFYIEYSRSDPDPALLYCLGELRELKYYVKLAEW